MLTTVERSKHNQQLCEELADLFLEFCTHVLWQPQHLPVSVV